MAEAAEELEEVEVVEEVEEVAPETWPEDWRQRIAGDDEKALKQLGRYATPADVWTKTKALESKITSGELKDNTPYPEKGTAEEQSQWRQSQGIPEAADKYELTREMEKDEREQLQPFFDYAHNHNLNPAQVNQMVDFFYQKYETDQELAVEGDKADLQDAEDKLRAEWGDEYRAHMNRINGFVDTVPGDIKGEFLDARLPDGSKLRSSPEAMQFLLRAALAVNPATVVTPSGGDVASGILDEIDQIKEVMRADRKKYDNDERMQARYTLLLETLEKSDPEAFAKHRQK